MTTAIGILALQGCIDPHRPHFQALGWDTRPVRQAGDLDGIAGLVLPGGESTALITLLNRAGMWSALASWTQRGDRPVWGICAGSILLAEAILPHPQPTLGVLPIHIQRNGYGRQLASRNDRVDGYPVAYIRAPIIQEWDPAVAVHARRDGRPTWCSFRHVTVTTFHAELTPAYPSPMHRAFTAAIPQRGR